MKKKIPLIVLEKLEKYVTLKGKQFEIIEPIDFLLRVVDIDIEYKKQIEFYEKRQQKNTEIFNHLFFSYSTILISRFRFRRNFGWLE